MSRNKEKANSILNRYLSQKDTYSVGHRPRTVQKCNNLQDAMQFRTQVLKDINQKLSRIHDMLITEYQIRDLNDEINKLLRERRAWEYRIKELGGPSFQNQKFDDNKESFILKGYKYFGRARELPDVMKMIENSKLEKKRGLDDQKKNMNQESAFQKINLDPDFNMTYFGIGEDLNDETDYVMTFDDMLGDSKESHLMLNYDTHQKFKELNAKYYKDLHSQTDNLKKFERSKTRQFQEKVSSLPVPPFIINEEFASDMPNKEAFEQFIINKKKQILLAKIQK